jgi:hypothetical protein
MRKIAAAGLFFVALSLSAGVTEVSLKLPVVPRLPIKPDQKVALAPFVISTTDASRTDRAAKIDVQAEFRRYLKKQLGRSNKMKLVEATSTRLPGSDMKTLELSRDYWKGVAAATGADFVISGLIDFDVEEKAGYKTEEYISPVDGRTYYRQVLIEKTGFVFDIVVLVFDGDTGEKLIEENFRDFKEFDERDYDELLGLFENLRSLETQLVGIFVPQESATTRYLFTR